MKKKTLFHVERVEEWKSSLLDEAKLNSHMALSFPSSLRQSLSYSKNRNKKVRMDFNGVSICLGLF